MKNDWNLTWCELVQRRVKAWKFLEELASTGRRVSLHEFYVGLGVE